MEITHDIQDKNPAADSSYQNESEIVEQTTEDVVQFDSLEHQFDEGSDKEPQLLSTTKKRTSVSKIKKGNVLPLNIQPKLTIGQPNDSYEKEADQMAEIVVQQFSNDSSSTISSPKNKPSIQRKTSNYRTSLNAPDSITQKLAQKRGQGNNLPAEVQTQMEQGFGTSFNEVRIHSDQSAIAMNQQLNARAFTYGSDIYFNKGEFAPETTKGKRLLGHELTHVVQQVGETKPTTIFTKPKNAEKSPTHSIQHNNTKERPLPDGEVKLMNGVVFFFSYSWYMKPVSYTHLTLPTIYSV